MAIDIAASRQEVTDDLRAVLADALDATEVHVYPQPPERPAFPAVIVTEAEREFITPDPDHFGGYLVRWQGLVACQPSPSNKIMTAQADALVTAILNGLPLLDPEIQSYATATLAGQNYLVAPITLTIRT